MNALILLAAGTGRRMGDISPDKTLTQIGGKPLAAYSLNAARDSGVIDRYIVVFRDDKQWKQLESVAGEIGIPSAYTQWIRGGQERQDSVRNALESLADNIAYVFIHDAARPLVRAETFRTLADAARKANAVCAARPVTDTIKETETPNQAGPSHPRTLDRSRLWRMETPQVFERKTILAGYREAERNKIRLTDDAAALELTGVPVTLFHLTYPNPKLTTPDDLLYIEFLLRQPGADATPSG